jgi:hypothetical protein
VANIMPHSLINPNQLQAYSIDVKDDPSRGPHFIADSETQF